MKTINVNIIIIFFVLFNTFSCYSQQKTQQLFFKDTIIFSDDSATSLIIQGELTSSNTKSKLTQKKSTLSKLWEEIWKFLLGLISGILFILLTGNINYRKKVVEDGIAPVKQLIFKIQYRLSIWCAKKRIEPLDLDLSDWASSFSIIDYYYVSSESIPILNQLDTKLTPIILSIESAETQSENYLKNKDKIENIIDFTKHVLHDLNILEDSMNMPIPKIFLKMIFTKRIKKSYGE